MAKIPYKIEKSKPYIEDLPIYFNGDSYGIRTRECMRERHVS